MKKVLFTSAIIFLLSILQSCCDFQGSYNLGNNFTLLGGDAQNQEIIVFCPPKRSGCCNGGLQLLPIEKNYYDGDYVADAKYDKDWIIIKILNDEDNSKEAKFWIIDKNFELDEKFKDWPLSKEVGKSLQTFLKSRIVGPLDQATFNNELKEKNIALSFDI